MSACIDFAICRGVCSLQGWVWAHFWLPEVSIINRLLRALGIEKLVELHRCTCLCCISSAASAPLWLSVTCSAGCISPPFFARSGVLDVAASVVALLRRFFPEHIDALEPEQAFLEVGWGLLPPCMATVRLPPMMCCSLW